MRIIKETIRECEDMDGNKTTVLELLCTHKKKEITLQVKDYSEEHREVIIKQLRGEVRKYFTKPE